jgi:hypothetical protein
MDRCKGKYLSDTPRGDMLRSAVVGNWRTKAAEKKITPSLVSAHPTGNTVYLKRYISLSDRISRRDVDVRPGEIGKPKERHDSLGQSSGVFQNRFSVLSDADTHIDAETAVSPNLSDLLGPSACTECSTATPRSRSPSEQKKRSDDQSIYLGPSAISLKPRTYDYKPVLVPKGEPREFQEGEIINTLWCNAYNPHSVVGADQANIATLPAGEVIAKRRYMVVLKIRPTHMTCLPVWTHRNQGPAVSATYPDDHMMFAPCSEEDNPTPHPLLEYQFYHDSRCNYGMATGSGVWMTTPFTVQRHGVKIKRTGLLKPESFEELKKRTAARLFEFCESMVVEKARRSSRWEY